jgi:hypothetical protein
MEAIDVEGNKKILMGVVLVVLVGLAVWLNLPDRPAYVPAEPEAPIEIGQPAAPERKPSRDRDRDENASRGDVEQLGQGSQASGPRDVTKLGGNASSGKKAKKPSVPIG